MPADQTQAVAIDSTTATVSAQQTGTITKNPLLSELLMLLLKERIAFL